MKQCFTGFYPNERIATALLVEGNLGLRISDILRLRLCDIVRDGNRYRLAIVEQKTGKERVFTVPLVIQQYLENYALRNSIGRTGTLFPITERAVQKQLALVCDYLGYEGISTHSFRKWYATEIYKNNGCDVALVQRLLQHSSASTTQRYIGIELQRIEKAIETHARLI
jgi:integrase